MDRSKIQVQLYASLDGGRARIAKITLPSPDGVHPDVEVARVSDREWSIRIGDSHLNLTSRSSIQEDGTISVDAANRRTFTLTILRGEDQEPVTYQMVKPPKRRDVKPRMVRNAPAPFIIKGKPKRKRKRN